MSGNLPAQRSSERGGSLERAGDRTSEQRMIEALARLEESRASVPLCSSSNRPAPFRGSGAEDRVGRLIFCLDLTGSRHRSLYQARVATADMLRATKSIGAVLVKLVYYRGTSECRASEWQDDPDVLSRAMQRLRCETGETQIARMLRLALFEPKRIDAVVFIGDHCEDDPAELWQLARDLGKRVRPIHVFHECDDCDSRSLAAKPVFKDMAEASGGVYLEFKPDSGAVLRELLSSLAAFSTAGSEGVKRIAPPQTAPARQLQKQLLLLGSGK